MENAEILLKLPQVEKIVGFKHSTIYKQVSAGLFPAPLRIGGRAVRWRSGDIQKWIDSLSTSGEARP